jgi:flagellar hook-basal body complex protein FliE
MLPAITAITSTSASAVMNGLQTQLQSQTPAQLPGLSPMMDTTGTDAAGSVPFGDLLTDAVGEVNRLQDQAGRTVRGLMTGTGVDVHQAMIATQKASMAFELSLAVRNKAVQAYQQVMSMQF